MTTVQYKNAIYSRSRFILLEFDCIPTASCTPLPDTHFHFCPLPPLPLNRDTSRPCPTTVYLQLRHVVIMWVCPAPHLYALCWQLLFEARSIYLGKGSQPHRWTAHSGGCTCPGRAPEVKVQYVMGREDSCRVLGSGGVTFRVSPVIHSPFRTYLCPISIFVAPQRRNGGTRTCPNPSSGVSGYELSFRYAANYTQRQQQGSVRTLMVSEI